MNILHSLLVFLFQFIELEPMKLYGKNEASGYYKPKRFLKSFECLKIAGKVRYVGHCVYDSSMHVNLCVEVLLFNSHLYYVDGLYIGTLQDPSKGFDFMEKNGAKLKGQLTR